MGRALWPDVAEPGIPARATRPFEAVLGPADVGRPDRRPLVADDAPVPARRRLRRLADSWGWELLVVVAVAGVLPLLAAGRYHALGQATSDDWSYFTSLSHLTQQGSINFNHWGTVFELGQLFLVSPLYAVFGVHPVLAVLWVWAVGMVGLLGVAYLGRRCGVGRRPTLLLLTTLMVCPLFFQLNTTFMTDVPCFTFMVLALCLWIDCTTRSHFEWRRWAAIGVATIAFTIREPAALVAVPILLEPLADALRSRDASRKLRYFAFAGTWVLVLGALWAWRQGASTSGWEPRIHLTPFAFLSPWVDGWLPSMLGLFMLPLLLTLSPWNLIPRIVRRHRPAALAVVFLGILVPLLGILTLKGSNPEAVQLGNYVSLDLAIPLALRILLSIIGLISCASTVLVLIAAARGRATRTVVRERGVRGLSQVVASYAAFIVGVLLIGIPLWDRYWLIVLALGGIILSRAGTALQQSLGPPPTHGVARPWSIAAALCLLTLYSAAVYSDTAATLAGEWNFANQAAAHLPAGYGAEDISANWLWDGTVYTQQPGANPSLAGHSVYRFPSHDPSGSFMFIYRGLVGTCAPWTVKTLRDGAQPPRAPVIGPTVRGLFVSIRFVLVHQPSKECTNVAQYLHAKN